MCPRVMPRPAREASNLKEPIVRAASQKPSPWIWVPFVWLFIASTRGLTEWDSAQHALSAANDADVSGDPLDRAVLMVLLILGLFVLNRRKRQVKRILLGNKCLMVLYGYMLLSAVWSNFPGITFRRSFRSMGVLVMVLVVLTENVPLSAIQALLRRLFLLHILGDIASIKYFRNLGVAYNWAGSEEEWVGLTNQKNNLGQMAMCSGLVFAWQALQNRKWKVLVPNLLMIALTLWVLRGSKNSHSTAAILGFIVSAAIILSLQFIKKRARHSKRLLLAGLAASMVAGPIVYAGFQAFDTTPVGAVMEATGRDMTFTDRTLIWTDVLNNAKKRPVLGVGYGAFWVGFLGHDLYPLPNWDRKTPAWRPNEGHNGFVDVYVDLGAVGIALLLIFICSAFAGALDDLQDNFELGRIRLALLVAILLNNIAESTILNGTQALWFLFLLVAVNTPFRRRRPPDSETAQAEVNGPWKTCNV